MAKSMEDKFRARIATIARNEVGQTACSRKTAGRKGFFTSCDSGFAGGQPEFWCSDFARWVWWKAGAINAGPKTKKRILTPESGSFALYGKLRNKPQVGDAVLFNYNKNIKAPNADHVAIVVKVNANGTIVSVSGDIGGNGSGAQFAATSRVVLDKPYHSKPGSSDPQAPNGPVSGYVSPVEDDMPYTKKQILNIVKDGVAAELNTKLDATGITPAQGAKAAVQAQQALAELAQQVADLTEYVKQHLPDPPPPPAGPAPNGGARGRRTGARTPGS
jgi:hypothetical protein